MSRYYHVSCSHNRTSILTHGLKPFEFTGFNETPGPIYMSKKKPTTNIRDMPIIADNKTTRILDDYMQLSSHMHAECPTMDLFEIDTSNLDGSMFSISDDNREILYSGIISPASIKLVKTYDMKRINDRYLENEKKLNNQNWYL
jgi:hypothetical protein